MAQPFKIAALGTDATDMTDTAVNLDTGFDAPSGTPLTPDTAAATPAPTLPGASPVSVPSLVAEPTRSPDGPTSSLESAEPAAEFTLLDAGELPTLAATATPTPAPISSESAEPVAEFTLPEGQAMPTLPEAAPTKPAEVADPNAGEDDTDVASDHPMGHLMPGKSKPSEASRKAAELRAAKKAKGRRIKIGLAVVFLAVAAVAGPPAFSWLSDAVNDAGDTSTEEPAN